MNLIIHAPQFKELEASWRGLFYLVSKTETGTMLQLRVLNATKAELLYDFDKTVEFDQSALFKKIYEAEYGTYGGLPYSLLLGDFYFSNTTQDIKLLKKIAEIAAAAHAPFITAAHASLFGLSDFTQLNKPRDLHKIFESVNLVAYQEFRSSEDSRYVSLVLPQVLLRMPYGKTTLLADDLEFEELVKNDISIHFDLPANNYLWGNAAYLLAERIANAFSIYRWPAAICGVNGGGLVEGLTVHSFTNDKGETETNGPTQVPISDSREKELNELGFVPLCEDKSNAVFFRTYHVQPAKKNI